MVAFVADPFLFFCFPSLCASACAWAHCGWMPSLEYDTSPQTGQYLRPGGKGESGLGFLWFMLVSEEQIDSGGDSTSEPRLKYYIKMVRIEALGYNA